MNYILEMNDYKNWTKKDLFQMHLAQWKRSCAGGWESQLDGIGT
jgi:hypothetical protein